MSGPQDDMPSPRVVDRAAFQPEIEGLRRREKNHMRAGDEIAAARRRLPMVPVDAGTPLLGERGTGMMHLACYLRRGTDVFETYWTWMRGVEAMDNNYRLLDLTA